MDDYIAKPVRTPQLKAVLERTVLRIAVRDAKQQAREAQGLTRGS
jgi:FixJ family two-component response regulator